MNYLLFAIRDLAAGMLTGQLMMLSHDAVAIRSFGEVCANPETLVSKYPREFDLVCLGELVDGLVVGYDEPRVVITAEKWFASQPAAETVDQQLPLLREVKRA